MATTCKWRSALAVRLTKQVSYSDKKSHTACLMIARFAPFSVLNDSRSISDDIIYAEKIKIE